MSSKSQSVFLSWLLDGALFVGIVGVFLFFAHYGMSLFYPAPAYDDFCNQSQLIEPTATVTSGECEAAGGKWHYESETRPQPQAPETSPAATDTQATTSTSTQVDGYCERDYECRQAYEDARSDHDRTAFAILAALGISVAVFGFRRREDSILSVSLSAAGVLLVLASTVRFWGDAEDWLQFGFLLMALMIFIYFGYQREQK